MAENDKEDIGRIKQVLNQTFKIKDLRDLRYFLGLEITRNKKGIMMNQRRYALEWLIGTSLFACKPALSPIDNHEKSYSIGSVLFTDVQAYKRLT